MSKIIALLKSMFGICKAELKEVKEEVVVAVAIATEIKKEVAKKRTAKNKTTTK